MQSETHIWTTTICHRNSSTPCTHIVQNMIKKSAGTENDLSVKTLTSFLLLPNHPSRLLALPHIGIEINFWIILCRLQTTPDYATYTVQLVHEEKQPIPHAPHLSMIVHGHLSSAAYHLYYHRLLRHSLPMG